MAKYAAKGATLTIDAVLIPSFRSITTSGGEAERIDVTTHDSTGGYREFVQGFKGESSVSFEILYDPNLAAHRGLVTLYETGEVVPVVVGLPTTPAASISFTGYVASFPLPSLPIDDAMTVEITIQVAGAITFPSGV